MIVFSGRRYVQIPQIFQQLSLSLQMGVAGTMVEYMSLSSVTIEFDSGSARLSA